MNSEFQRIIEYRRSNRKFDANTPVPNEVIQTSIERAILSPNSSNMQLWEFHWIQSKEMLETFVPLCLGQSAAQTAQQMVVFVTRKDKWKSRAKWNLDMVKASIVGEPDKAQKMGMNYYGKIMPLVYSTELMAPEIKVL